MKDNFLGNIIMLVFAGAFGVFLISNISSFDAIINSLSRVGVNTLGILEQQPGYPRMS